MDVPKKRQLTITTPYPIYDNHSPLKSSLHGDNPPVILLIFSPDLLTYLLQTHLSNAFDEIFFVEEYRGEPNLQHDQKDVSQNLLT